MVQKNNKISTGENTIDKGIFNIDGSIKLAYKSLLSVQVIEINV